MREQEEGLAGALRHDEVVLWFEQDLFCAVNLWYLLAWFSRRPAAARLVLVYPPTDAVKGLGRLEPAQLAALFTERRLVTPHALALGRRAWEAYTDADPRGAVALADQDDEALPFVRQAFQHHCERFPSVATGLNEIETATLETLDRGTKLSASCSARSLRIPARDSMEWATCSSRPACAGSHHWSASRTPMSRPLRSPSRRSAARYWPGAVTGAACERSTSGSAASTSRATVRAGAGTAPAVSSSSHRRDGYQPPLPLSLSLSQPLCLP